MNPAVTDLPGNVYIGRRGRQRGPDRRDPALRYRDVLHSVKTRFGVDHAAAAQHQVPVANGRLLGTSVSGGAGVPAAVGC